MAEQSFDSYQFSKLPILTSQLNANHFLGNWAFSMKNTLA